MASLWLPQERSILSTIIIVGPQFTNEKVGLEGSGDLQTKEFHPSALPVFLPMQWELGEAKTDG